MPAAATARGPKCFMFDRGRAPRVLVRLAFPERGSHSIVSPGTSAVEGLLAEFIATFRSTPFLILLWKLLIIFCVSPFVPTVPREKPFALKWS